MHMSAKEKFIGSLALALSIFAILFILALNYNKTSTYHDDYVPGDQYAPELSEVNATIQNQVASGTSTNQKTCMYTTPITYGNPLFNCENLGKEFSHVYWLLPATSYSSTAILSYPTWIDKTEFGKNIIGVSSILFDPTNVPDETAKVYVTSEIAEGTYVPIICPFSALWNNTNLGSVVADSTDNWKSTIEIISSDKRILIKISGAYWFCDGNPATWTDGRPYGDDVSNHYSIIGNSALSNSKVVSAGKIIGYATKDTKFEFYELVNNKYQPISICDWLCR